MSGNMIVITVWIICAVITAYGATYHDMKKNGEVSLLAIIGYIVMNIIPIIAIGGAVIFTIGVLEQIKFKKS